MISRYHAGGLVPADPDNIEDFEDLADDDTFDWGDEDDDEWDDYDDDFEDDDEFTEEE